MLITSVTLGMMVTTQLSSNCLGQLVPLGHIIGVAGMV